MSHSPAQDRYEAWLHSLTPAQHHEAYARVFPILQYFFEAIDERGPPEGAHVGPLIVALEEIVGALKHNFLFPGDPQLTPPASRPRLKEPLPLSAFQWKEGQGC